MRFRPILAILVLGAAGLAALRYLPDRYNPLAPVHLDERPSLLTAWKLRDLKDDPAACFAALEAAGVHHTAVEDSATGQGCGFHDAALLHGSSVAWGGDVAMSCPLLAATMVWEQHDLQPLAQLHLGQSVTRVRHLGTYACRNINNRQAGARSEHARANAIDVAGFVLADGDEVSVRRDWKTGGAKAAFLRAIRDRACGRFASVLSPDYNALHADHFHFDMGRYNACR